MPTLAPQQHSQSVNEVRVYSLDLKGKLDEGETATGTPTVSEVTTTDLVITSEQVSGSELLINKRYVPAGEAAQFKVDASAATPGTDYDIDIFCGTSAGQTIDGRVTISITT